MLHKLRQRAQDEKGFTLIELLVVILIIGILAAIALPAFLNQRAKAQDTEAKSAARTAQTALETLYIDEQNYATPRRRPLAGHRARARRGVAAAGPTSPPGRRSVHGRRSRRGQDGHHFKIAKAATAAVTRTCTAGRQGRLPRRAAPGKRPSRATLCMRSGPPGPLRR